MSSTAEPHFNGWEITHKEPVVVGRDEGCKKLGPKTDYSDCPVCEYIWVDAHGVPRSKTKTLTKKPSNPSDLPVWNFDGSSTEQAPGSNSEILLVPRAIFRDPFRGGEHTMCLAECVTPDMRPAIGNYRAAAAEVLDRYASSDPWFGIE